MKKVDPARYIGKRKAAELEIKTLGTPPPLEPIGRSPDKKATKLGGQPPKRSRGQEARRLRGWEAKRSGGQPPKKSASQEVRRLPDENTIAEGWQEEMVWKGSHLYTESERNLFDQVVLELRQAYGLEVHKRILARAALRLLATDLRRRGEDSFIVALVTGQLKKWIERITSQEAKKSGGQPPKKLAS